MSLLTWFSSDINVSLRMPKTKVGVGQARSPDSSGTDSSVLNSKIKAALEEIPQSHDYLIGLSGGLDSLALIHFCVPYLRQFTSSVKAIHVHHGLSEHADEWAQFCLKVCHAIDLELIVERVQVKVEGEGLEAAARNARYQAFSRYMQQSSVLLLGHHLNDQAETLLMRFLKGLGPSGLRGILRQRAFAGGLIFRPWLHVPRAVLEKQIRCSTKDWVEDESNQDRRFERNFLRHDVLPLLERRRPSVLQDLQHAADRSADYVAFVEHWCRQQEAQFLSQAYSMEKAIDLKRLKRFTELEQKFILRYWFDTLGVHQPGDANFSRILSDLIAPDAVSKAEVLWRDYCARVFDGTLFCFRSVDLLSQAYEHVIPLGDILDKGEKPFRLALPDGVLLIEKALEEGESGGGLSSSIYQYDIVCFIPAETEHLVIRSKKPGDQINLNQDFSQTLKKLYQTHRVLPWHRESIPVLLAGSGSRIDQKVCLEQSKVSASLAGFVACSIKDAGAQPAVKLVFKYLTSSGLLNGQYPEMRNSP